MWAIALVIGGQDFGRAFRGSDMASEQSGSKRIAAAIITAGVIVAVVPIVRDAVDEYRARQVVETFTKQLEAEAQESQRRAAVAAYRAKPVMPATSSAVPLRSGEACTGGYVVRPLAPPAKGWEQVLEHGRPARCSGRYRVR